MIHVPNTDGSVQQQVLVNPKRGDPTSFGSNIPKMPEITPRLKQDVLHTYSRNKLLDRDRLLKIFDEREEKQRRALAQGYASRVQERDDVEKMKLIAAKKQREMHPELEPKRYKMGQIVRHTEDGSSGVLVGSEERVGNSMAQRSTSPSVRGEQWVGVQAAAKSTAKSVGSSMILCGVDDYGDDDSVDGGHGSDSSSPARRLRGGIARLYGQSGQHGNKYMRLARKREGELRATKREHHHDHHQFESVPAMMIEDLAQHNAMGDQLGGKEGNFGNSGGNAADPSTGGLQAQPGFHRDRLFSIGSIGSDASDSNLQDLMQSTDIYGSVNTAAGSSRRDEETQLVMRSSGAQGEQQRRSSVGEGGGGGGGGGEDVDRNPPCQGNRKPYTHLTSPRFPTSVADPAAIDAVLREMREEDTHFASFMKRHVAFGSSKKGRRVGKYAS